MFEPKGKIENRRFSYSNFAGGCRGVQQNQNERSEFQILLTLDELKKSLLFLESIGEAPEKLSRQEFAEKEFSGASYKLAPEMALFRKSLLLGYYVTS